MKTTLLLLSLLALALQFVESRVYYYYYQPNSHNNQNDVTYETQYVLVNTRYGSYYQAVQVPVQRPTPRTTTTTTTTTTRPPPPPRLSPTIFFSHCNSLPMQLYSNYICGVFSQPHRQNWGHGKRSVDETSNSTRIDFTKLTDIFQTNEISNESQDSSESESIEQRSDQNNRLETRQNSPQFTSSDEMFYWLRKQLLRGISASTRTTFRAALSSEFSVPELEYLINIIYDNKFYLVNSASEKVRMFYVNNVASSPDWLADADKKRLLVDLIMITNGRAACDECVVDFRNSQQIVDALYQELLPAGMTNEQKRSALAGINFLSTEKFSASDASQIFTTFVDDFTQTSSGPGLSPGKRDASSGSSSQDDGSEDESNESPEDEDNEEDDENKDFESFISAVLHKGNGRKKRIVRNEPVFDLQMTCFVLSNYITSSPYCGVKVAASQMYNILQCYYARSPIQPVAQTRKPTTVTPAPTTTTTAPTTTTTRKPVATTRPPTTPSPATQPPTTTPAPSVQCGISDVATRSAQVSSSDLFISPRVVGGRITGTCTTYPWMVRLTVNKSAVCGGAILDATHILTAAHCAANKYHIKATVGEYDTSIIDGTEQVFDVDTDNGVSVHPDFNAYLKTNDVAVLTLNKPIDFDEICAAPICLNPNFAITNGQSCTIAGWGATSENSETASTVLQEASIQTFNGTDCPAVFPKADPSYFSDPTRQLCAGQPNVGGVDTCQGDSGGPLMCLDQSTSTWVAAGIVSFGEGCGQADSPGVYIRTSVYYDWITQQLKN